MWKRDALLTWERNSTLSYSNRKNEQQNLNKQRIFISYDELEIYSRHYTKVFIHLEKTLRIYYDHWWQNVTDGPMVTKWVVASKQRFCNAIVVEHKCNTSLPINEAYNYKREDNRNQKYTQILYEITLNSFFSTNLSPLLT